MTKNRNQLIKIFVGNISNTIVHNILEESIKKEKPELSDKYRKEKTNSFDISKIYREKINPIDKPLPSIDQNEIKGKILNRVQAEISLRISKGYQNLSIQNLEQEINFILKNLKVID